VPVGKGSASGKDKKSKTIYVCEDCGEDFAQWHGKCPNCSAWNTLKQLRIAKPTDANVGGGAGVKALAGLESGRNRAASQSRQEWVTADEGPKLLRDINLGANSGDEFRLRFQDEDGAEFGRVLGGGIVPGSMCLVGGDPGVGKSTLLLQVANLLSQEQNGDSQNNCVLYVSGEESVQQLALRAGRLGVDPNQTGLYLYSATNLEEILTVASQLRPAALVIDSIQTVYLAEARGVAGSVSQIRECSIALLQLAKAYKIATFVIGHVTKMGERAGPRVLEHLVDVVLYLEGERFEHHRLLRSVKNRYGATDEIGVFKMGTKGMEPVLNPSELFSGAATDSSTEIYPAVTATMEGTRPILVEIQALCSDIQGGGDDSKSKYIRSANGVNYSRLYMLLAVLSKHAGVYVGNRSLFINVTGGLRLQEPATDLAVLMAVASSYLDRRIIAGTAFIGEIGLGGEIRAVGQVERRVTEAAKVGFNRCIVPFTRDFSLKIEGIEVVPCRTVREAIDKSLE
jgi:DNA repair protein RadA/Sms